MTTEVMQTEIQANDNVYISAYGYDHQTTAPNALGIKKPSTIMGFNSKNIVHAQNFPVNHVAVTEIILSETQPGQAKAETKTIYLNISGKDFDKKLMEAFNKKARSLDLKEDTASVSLDGVVVSLIRAVWEEKMAHWETYSDAGKKLQKVKNDM